MPAPANPNILKQIKRRPVKPAATPDPFFKGVEKAAGSIGHSLWNLAQQTNIAQAVQRKGIYSPHYRDTPGMASQRALLDIPIWPGALPGMARSMGAFGKPMPWFRNPLVQGAAVRAFKEGYYDPTHPRGR